MYNVDAPAKRSFPAKRHFYLPPSYVLQAERHPLLEGLFLAEAGYHPQIAGHRVKRPKGFREMILIACTSGCGWVELGSKKRLPVQAGEIVGIPPGPAHAYGADDTNPWGVMWTHFRGSQLPLFIKLLGLTSTHPVLKLPAGTLETLRFDELYLTFESGCTLSNLLAGSARLRMILIELARMRVPAHQRTGSMYEILRKNIEWMRVHCNQKIGLAELAAQAGLSIPHYSACFKRQTGYSPMNYFQRLKIQHSAQLLSLTELHVDEIAAEVGLEDPFYFSRLFKKVMGQSPRNFRSHRKH